MVEISPARPVVADHEPGAAAGRPRGAEQLRTVAEIDDVDRDPLDEPVQIDVGPALAVVGRETRERALPDRREVALHVQRARSVARRERDDVRDEIVEAVAAEGRGPRRSVEALRRTGAAEAVEMLARAAAVVE